MQVTLDAGAILIGVVTVLIGIIEVFGMLWIRSVQAGLREAKELAANLQTQLSALREDVARDYVPRAENRDLRDEFRSSLASIDQKLADINNYINNKLDRKQDKQ